MLLTQGVLLALCGARVVVDLQSGPLTIEGYIALVLLVILTVSLAVAGGSVAVTTWPREVRRHAGVPRSTAPRSHS